MNAKITFVLGITATAACFAGVAAVAAPNAEETPAPEIIREMDSLKLAYTPKPTPEPTAEPTAEPTTEPEPEVEPEVTEDPLPEFDSLVGTISPEAPAAEQPFSRADEELPVDSVPPVPAEVTPMSYDEYVQSFINDGLSVGDVIVCENGWTVGIDEYEGGISWAACM